MATKFYVCTSCGYHGEAKSKVKGNFAIEVLLWFFLIIPGLVYSIWRLTNRHIPCPKCDNETLIPDDSPVAKNILSSNKNNAEQTTPQSIPQRLSVTEKNTGSSFLKIVGIIFLVIIGVSVISATMNTSKRNSSDENGQDATQNEIDFEIISYSGKWEGGRLRIVGEVKNTGTVAAGVEILAVARDVNGQIVDSEAFWPNSVNNIAPGASYPIGYTVTTDSRAKSIEASINSTKVWNR